MKNNKNGGTMRKLVLLLLMVILVSGCFNKELSDEEFNAKNIAGTYSGKYISEKNNIEFDFEFEVNEKKELVSIFFTGHVLIDKKYNVKGEAITIDGTIKYKGKLTFTDDNINGEGTWKSSNDSGTWIVQKEGSL
jgi:hypothetical protein